MNSNLKHLTQTNYIIILNLTAKKQYKTVNHCSTDT